jgi:hypothetical protein
VDLISSPTDRKSQVASFTNLTVSAGASILLWRQEQTADFTALTGDVVAHWITRCIPVSIQTAAPTSTSVHHTLSLGCCIQVLIPSQPHYHGSSWEHSNLGRLYSWCICYPAYQLQTVSSSQAALFLLNSGVQLFLVLQK